MVAEYTHLFLLPERTIKRMQATQQNPNFHGEGNVYQHTLMVLDHVRALDESWGLTDEERVILYWTALLHDVGKPDVTRWEGGRFRSHGHEKAGIPIARNILLQRKELSQKQRNTILNLVRWHSVPLRYGLKEEKLDMYKQIALQVDMRLLGVFAYCDLKGRICKEPEKIHKIIQDFNEQIVPTLEASLGTYAQIHALYQSARIQDKNHLWEASKFSDFRLLEELFKSVDTTEKRAAKQTWIIPLGVPCIAQKAFLNSKYPDAYHLNQVILNRPSPQIPTQAQTVVIAGDFTHTASRQAWLSDWRKKPAEIHLLVFEKDLEQLLKNVHNPMQYMEIRKAYERMENPHPWEAHQVEYIQL